MKNGKAAGIDGIPFEVLIYVGEKISEYLYKLLNKIWEAERIPTKWNEELLVKLPKKGDLNCCENW